MKIKVYLLGFLLILNASLIASEPFYIYTAPKTGTHLLFKALFLMTGRPVGVFGSYEEYIQNQSFSDYIWSHHKICHTHKLPPPDLFKELQENHIKMVSIIRDPRDQLISLIFFEHKTKNYKDNPLLGLPDVNQPLTK